MVATCNKLLQIIMVAHTPQKCLDSNISVKSKSLQVTYSSYVKSQIHLNVISAYYDENKRAIYEYFNADKFLEGDLSYREDAIKVLMYLYEDMSGFLLHNLDDINFNLNIDAQLNLPIVTESFNKVRHDLLKICKIAAQEAGLEVSTRLTSLPEWNDISSKNYDLFKLMDSFICPGIFDEIQLVSTENDYLDININNCVNAAIIRKCLADGEPKILNMEVV